MKSNNLLFAGMIILGVSIIISSIILSNPKIEQLQNVNSVLNGSLSMNQTMTSSDSGNTSDILKSDDAAIILGYNSSQYLIRDILGGNPEGIPYVLVDKNYLFSKKALEEWVYSKSLNK